MTLTETRPDRSVLGGEALIKEARRRQRRRRIAIAAVTIVAATGAFGLVSRNGRHPTGDDGTSQPEHIDPPSTPPPSTAVELNRPAALALAPGGELLISNQGTHQILRRLSDGELEVVAGSGIAGSSGDGDQAVNAELDMPWGIAVGPDGTIYFADSANNRVRAISPTGVITTVAGTGTAGSAGDGGPAIAAELLSPQSVALGADGRLYIADSDRVRVVAPSGLISTAISGGPASIAIDGTANAFFPNAVAVDVSGNLFVASHSPKLVVEFSPDGTVRRSWPAYVTPAGLAAIPTGGVIAADYGRFSLDLIFGSSLDPALSFSPNSLTGIGGVFRPSGVAVAPDGTIYAVTDGVNGGADRAAIIAVDRTGSFQVL